MKIPPADTQDCFGETHPLGKTQQFLKLNVLQFYKYDTSGPPGHIEFEFFELLRLVWLKITNNQLGYCFSSCLFESRLASSQSNPDNVPFYGLEQVSQVKRVH